jgi:kynurenine formamidase
MMGRAVVLDLTAKGKARASITPDDLIEAEGKLQQQGVEIQAGGMLLLRTDWPKGHDTTDPKWWNDSPYLTKEAAQWVVDKKPSVVGFDFAQEEKGSDYQSADQILGSAMRVHRTILPRVTFQIENLINLDRIGPTAQVIALPVKWKTESAPARVIALLDN